MGNMLDYLDWRGDLTLEHSPFNEVDNLILSQLAYMNFDFIVSPEQSELTVTVREAADRYFNKYSEDQIQQLSYNVRKTVPLLRKLANCARFAEAKLSNFENIIDHDQTKQFAALHIELSDGSVYISYRGTDNTLVGWKEDFNMSIMTPIPAQFEAVRYLESTFREEIAVLRVGGHSKGGNLAVYAAVMCRSDVKKRIAEVYNNDGPGFDGEFTKSESYQEILGKIRKIIPQSSVVGMMMEYDERYLVIKSSQKLLMQHEAFSWEVLGTSFVRAERLAKESEIIDSALKSWLNQVDKLQRMLFFNELFQIFEDANIRTLEDFSHAKWKMASRMIRALNQSRENKLILAKAVKLLFQNGRKAFFSSRNENNKKIEKFSE